MDLPDNSKLNENLSIDVSRCRSNILVELLHLNVKYFTYLGENNNEGIKYVGERFYSFLH